MYLLLHIRDTYDTYVLSYSYYRLVYLKKPNNIIWSLNFYLLDFMYTNQKTTFVLVQITFVIYIYYFIFHKIALNTQESVFEYIAF